VPGSQVVSGMRRIPVMQLSDLPENSNKAVAIEGTTVLFCRTEKGLFAVDNICSHMLAPLEGGRVRGVHLFCPKHGVRFDLRTGMPSALTKTPIKTYPVSVADGMIEVEMPA
jgi:3-phenylpropionate/trans-cinnamate dioxygenase ferredoxin component